MSVAANSVANRMRQVIIQPHFAAWRDRARALLNAEIAPEHVVWVEQGDATLDGLLSEGGIPQPGRQAPAHRVPGRFMQLAESAACFIDPGVWALLYRDLWRVTHGEARLMEISVDDDVHRLEMMEKAVRRDAHKMKAFVRFRLVHDELGEHYIAFHRPEHRVIRRVAPFFADRFAAMRWTILTPRESASWDLNAVSFGPGVDASQAPADDELEGLWRTYYGAIFNPARINLQAMRQHMPQRHWRTMPEAQDIPDLLREAPSRVEAMMAKTAQCASTGSASDFLPTTLALPQLREAAKGCRGCEIYCNATQVVFGEGPSDAVAMFVGEQPGDSEDRAGKPFIGPAGQVLDEAMQEAGVPRDRVYVTNAVKHFKFEPRGPRRIHSKPSSREVKACKPWLEAEISVVKPKMIVCLGATAAQSLMGPAFRLTQHRGEVMQTQYAPWLIATLHPSALLRMPDPVAREESRKSFVHDLRLAAEQLRKMSAV